MIVEQSKMNVNVLWGFLSIAFALMLWRGHQGAQTDAGRLVVDVVASAGVIISIAAWISFHRHPAQLDISEEIISFSHRGKPNSVELCRTGDLYVYRRISARGAVQSYLKVVGSDDAIPLVLFDWKKVERACRAAGWHIMASPAHPTRRKRSAG